MKKSLFLLASFVTIAIATMAQTRVVNSTVPQGQFIYLTGVNQTVGDSLQVSDSIAYLTYVQHPNDVSPYMTWYWNKIGAGTATIALSFLQSNDGVNYFPVKAGTGPNQVNYVKNYTLSANTWSEVSFARDTALLVGRYLKTYYITSSTASVKGKLINQLKINIK